MAIPELAGKVVNCPVCTREFRIPKPPSADTFAVACGCGKTYQVKRELAGKRVQCAACGNKFEIPVVPVALPAPRRQVPLPEAPAPATGLGPLDALGDLSNIGPQFGLPPPTYAALPPVSMPAYSLPATSYRPRTKSKPINWSLIAAIGGGVLACILVLSLGIAAYTYWPFGLSFGLDLGYSSPQAAFDAQKQAQLNKDWATLYYALTPETRDRLVGAIAAIGSWMPTTDGELEAIYKKYGVADELEPPKIDSLGDMANFAKILEDSSRHAAAAISDKKGFFVDVLNYFDKKGREQGEEMKGQWSNMAGAAELHDLVIDGDRAFGKISSSAGGVNRQSTVEFRRLHGRWYIHMNFENTG